MHLWHLWPHRDITSDLSLAGGYDLESLNHLSNICELWFLSVCLCQELFYMKKSNKKKRVDLASVDTNQTKSVKHVVWQICKGLQDSRYYTTSQFRQTWQRESGLEMSDDDWNDLIKTTNSRSWREFCQKNVISSFLHCKGKLLTAGFSGLTECWKQCDHSRRTMHSVFWRSLLPENERKLKRRKQLLVAWLL